MAVFKILLIILVAAPVIALALYFYFQMLGFIRKRNRKEEAFIKARMDGTAELRERALPDRVPEVEEERPAKRSGSGKKQKAGNTDKKTEKKTAKKTSKKASKKTEKKRKK